MGKKKVNPRRIPLPKNAADKDAIIEEAMKDDMTHGWLLVASALSDLGYDNISELSDAVNSFIETGSALDDETKNIQKKAAWSSKEHRDAEIRRARSVLGIPNTPLNADKVKSPVELAAFKKKVQKVALQVALSVIYIYLGLEGTGRFSQDELKKVFFSADLTLAEIESGANSFENIERELLNRMVSFELAKVNTTETTQTKEN